MRKNIFLRLILQKKTLNDYLNHLNPEQKQAVEQIDGPMIVIAGAGSGKTRVLTYRIAHLIKNGINPFNILSLTFTNKASREMRDRIQNIIGDNDAKNIWMGTFHSVFSKILRIESHYINYPKNYTIYDTEDSKSLIRSIIKELNLNKDFYKVNIIRSRISTMKNNFISPDEYVNNPEIVLQDKIAKRTNFIDIYKSYTNRCIKYSAMDFDDLLINTYKLLNSFPEILLKYQRKFEYILIDEYQDTNHIQYLIIKKLAALNENICVVGDDAQSIYAFRGANIQNILNFQSDYPDFKSFKLEQNYRSTKSIVETANHLISFNKKQLQKKVWTNNSIGSSVVIHKCSSDNEEAKLVANTIFDLKIRDDFFNNDFCVLYRTNAQSRAIEEALRKKNINYKIYGGISFYQRKEIKDILAYFRVIVNQNDDESLKRIINYPSRGIGLTTLNRLSLKAIENDTSIWSIIENIEHIDININKGTKKKLIEFYELIQKFILMSQKCDAYTLANDIIHSSKIYTELHNDKTPEGVSRFENIQELLNGVKTFAEQSEDEVSLGNYLQEIALITDMDNENDKEVDKITLMTIHAAKGLEFPNVFVVGIEENLFPSMLSLESEQDLEEERRLFYVAITRAMKNLFLSYSTFRFRWGQYIDCSESRFLNELDEKYVVRNEQEIQFSKPKFSFKKKSFPTTNRSLKSVKKIENHEAENYVEHKFSIGDRIEHQNFGKGSISNIEGFGSSTKACVNFDNFGEKTLLLKFAKLKLLNN
mgnify:FL=1